MAQKSPYLIPFTHLKNKVLGRNFILSLVLIDDKLSRRLNKTYRKKNKPANVLSFLLSKQTGEIFIDLVTAKKEMGKFEMGFAEFVAFLFIHGLHHLNGMEHGDTMEQAEQKLFHDTSNRSGYRHRNLSHQSSDRRRVN